MYALIHLGVVTTLAGGGSAGGVASGHADGTGSAAMFNNPAALSVNSAGTIFISDTSNNLIRSFTTSGTITACYRLVLE